LFEEFYEENRLKMKILHILNDTSTDLTKRIIAVQSKEHEVTVIELFSKDTHYEDVIDDIFSHDRVVSW
jgi:hypothetical protein